MIVFSPAKLMKYFQHIIQHRQISVLTIPRQHLQPAACSYRISPEDLAKTGILYKVLKNLPFCFETAWLKISGNDSIRLVPGLQNKTAPWGTVRNWTILCTKLHFFPAFRQNQDQGSSSWVVTSPWCKQNEWVNWCVKCSIWWKKIKKR